MNAVEKIAAYVNGLSPDEVEELHRRTKKFKKRQYDVNVLEGLR